MDKLVYIESNIHSECRRDGLVKILLPKNNLFTQKQLVTLLKLDSRKGQFLTNLTS